MRYYKRLPLETLSNARDLGGYPADGGVTRYGVFVRTEVPKALTENDIRFLQEYGITMSLDLRGVKESEDLPSKLIGVPGHRYELSPMFDTEAAKASPDAGDKGGKEVPPPQNPKTAGPGEDSPFDMDWTPVYINMLERGKGWMKHNLELAAECKGGMLFHCFTGKDRTGCFSALLLGLCGVSTPDIIGDYSLSMSFLRPFYADMPGDPFFVDEEGKPDFSRGFYRTAPETMERTVNYLEKTYGSITDYVRACGVSEETIEKIRGKFIEKF